MTTLHEKVFAALSSLVSTRAYPGTAPAGVARPYAVFKELSRVGSYTLKGSTGTSRVHLELIVYDDDIKALSDFDALSSSAKAAIEAIPRAGGQQTDGGSDTDPATHLRWSRMLFEIWDRPS